MKVMSFDLDSTVCDTMHRRHVINTTDRNLTDWMAYSMACGDDSEGPAFPLLTAWYESGGEFIVVSRRFTEAKALTEKWFAERGLFPLDMLMLKDEFPGSESRVHAEWKVNAIKHFVNTYDECVRLHVDDLSSVTEAMTAAGIPALTVSSPNGEGENA